MTLQTLNTYRTGYAGLLVGSASVIVPPVVAFFKLITQPTYLLELAHALDRLYWTIERHDALPSADAYVMAQLVAALIAIGGGFVVAFLLCYYGRPKTV